MIEVTVARLAVDRSTDSPVVVLQERDGDRVLPIWIGGSEATAIALELNGARPARPLTHDLLKRLLQGLGGTLRRVLVTDVRDSTYYAELLVQHGDTQVTIDARPSDAIALALRTSAPILVAEALLRRPGEEGAPPAGDGAAEAAEALKRRLQGLDPQDFGRFQP